MLLISLKKATKIARKSHNKYNIHMDIDENLA